MTTETRDIGTKITNESHKLADALATQGERLGEKLDSVAASTRDVYHRGRERAESWGESLGGLVREQPVTAILIAAGVGLLIGAIGRRR